MLGMKIETKDQVADFIHDADKESKGRISRMVSVLEELGHRLRMPYSKNIGQNLFELRVIGKQNIRLIYTFRNDSAIIFYAFFKKTQQIETRVFDEIRRRFNNL